MDGTPDTRLRIWWDTVATPHDRRILLAKAELEPACADIPWAFLEEDTRQTLIARYQWSGPGGGSGYPVQ